MGTPKMVVGLQTEKLANYLAKNSIKPSVLSVNMGASSSYIERILSGGNKMSQMAYTSMCHILEVPESMFLEKKQGCAVLNSDQLDRIERKLDTILRRLGC